MEGVWMPNVTFRQLQVFTEAAQALSFAQVAKTLRLTPSAVSFQIRQIEDQTGAVLFERIGRRVALTEAGRVLLGYARPMLQSMSDLDRAMTALKGMDSGRVRLGLVSTGKYIVPHIIARYRARAPNVMVSLHEGNRATILNLLLAGDIDLAVMGQPPEGGDVTAERFAAHPSVIAAAAAHPLRREKRLPPRALAKEWFIVREPGSGTRALSEKFFAEAGFLPKIAMETSSNEMIKQAVIAGMGIALISQHTLSLEQALGLLETLPVQGFPVMRSWFVVQRRTAPLLPVQVGLRDFLIENGEEIIAEIGRGWDRLRE
jgi:DNA-binding transcriptional LysR family regulator